MASQQTATPSTWDKIQATLEAGVSEFPSDVRFKDAKDVEETARNFVNYAIDLDYVTGELELAGDGRPLVLALLDEARNIPLPQAQSGEKVKEWSRAFLAALQDVMGEREKKDKEEHDKNLNAFSFVAQVFVNTQLFKKADQPNLDIVLVIIKPLLSQTSFTQDDVECLVDILGVLAPLIDLRLKAAKPRLNSIFRTLSEQFFNATISRETQSRLLDLLIARGEQWPEFEMPLLFVNVPESTTAAPTASTTATKPVTASQPTVAASASSSASASAAPAASAQAAVQPAPKPTFVPTVTAPVFSPMGFKYEASSATKEFVPSGNSSLIFVQPGQAGARPRSPLQFKKPPPDYKDTAEDQWDEYVDPTDEEAFDEMERLMLEQQDFEDYDDYEDEYEPSQYPPSNNWYRP